MTSSPIEKPRPLFKWVSISPDEEFIVHETDLSSSKEEGPDSDPIQHGPQPALVAAISALLNPTQKPRYLYKYGRWQTTQQSGRALYIQCHTEPSGAPNRTAMEMLRLSTGLRINVSGHLVWISDIDVFFKFYISYSADCLQNLRSLYERAHRICTSTAQPEPDHTLSATHDAAVFRANGASRA
jgi:hypothetical protein